MANSKENKSWVMPSFDCEPLKKSSTIKSTLSQTLERNTFDVSFSYDIIPQKKSTSNLFALLEASEPKKPSELVVSRQKQQEIADWLQYKVRKGRPCALILSGVSGCGKTAALRVISKENGFNVTEWITPIDQAMDENNRVPRQADRFEEFVIRATRYSSVLSNCHNRLLLVKDFPNVFIQDKDSFFSLLEKYFEMGKEPIVFVCTETGNSRLLQTLFPPNIREKFGVDLIKINPVTQTAMKSALKRIGGILNSIADHMICVSQDKIDEIMSNSIGDIRNAIINLIFISLKVPEKQQEKKCNVRETTLGLLHGVGQVINPKKIQNGNSWKFVHDPDNITSYFQSQATVFLNFLQENYLNTIRGIEEVNICANILSLADTLNSEWRDPNLTKVTLSFCVRGVMVANVNPISGWNPVRKPQNERTEMQRSLAAAEIRWYESIINSKSKATEKLLDIDMEAVIE
ncbi:PREDICTED: cell cycle checkpoint protein RAD17 [Dufourea novaeangliae]|uniref:cell cycle checkpoint protein RAD17 n=1 Tax=Dufourea novaeangliae TaxID=178035 RepID=UPI000767952F|nr:PREDICTED: cell cycle checkpoint protein RAD17 [Dufourea novaeangliae]